MSLDCSPLSETSTEIVERASVSDRVLAVGFIVALAVLSVAFNVWSRGFLEADGVTHYLYARWAFNFPWLFSDVWGRPIVTTLHALPAQIPGSIFGQPLGLIGVRLTSLVLAIGGVLVAWKVAAGQPEHERPSLAAVCTLASPLVLLHSFAELTELPFALMSIACLLLYQKKQWIWLALLGGFLPAARPEGIGFALMIFGGLILHRRWLAAPLVLVGPLAWATAGWILGGHPYPADGSPLRPLADALPSALQFVPGVLAWLPDHWPYSETSVYDSGPLLKFVGMLPAVTGSLLFPFMLLGAAISFIRWRDLLSDHLLRVRWIVAFIPLFVLFVHSLLHWTGKMASSGDVRYLVAVAPFWGLLAALGVERAMRWLRVRRVALAAIVLAVLPWLALQARYPIVPLTMDAGSRNAEAVAGWWQSAESAELRERYPNLRVDHPVFRYRADTPPNTIDGRLLVERRPSGTVFLWDKIYSVYNADERLTVSPEVLLANGWRDVTPQPFIDDWRVFASE